MTHAPRTLGILAAALTTLLWAGSAFGAGYCDDKTPCKAEETCLAGLCVPNARLCTSDSGCTAWQKCDFTCPWMGQSGGGSTGTVDAGVAYADATSTEPAQDGGSSGGGSGAGKMPAYDAGGAQEDPMPPDQDGRSYSDVEYDVPPPASCPKTQGVCVADPKKVAVQDGCMTFCSAMMKCGGLGGTTTTDPGGTDVPPDPAADASAGFAPPYPTDAGETDPGGGARPEDASSNTDVGEQIMPQPDTTGPTEDDLTQCVLYCSILKLEKVAQAEFTALEQCVAANAETCDKMDASCNDSANALEKAMQDDWMWSLGFAAYDVATGGEEKGDATSGGLDTATPNASDAASDGIGGPGQTGGSASVSETSDGGCTAGAQGSAVGPLGMMLLALAAIGLRRRQVRVRS